MRSFDGSGVNLLVDRMCDRFERALQVGERPDILSFLAEGGPSAGHALPELVGLELEYRIRQGEQISAADYFHRFPALGENLAEARRLIELEWRTLQIVRPEFSEREFRARYANVLPANVKSPTERYDPPDVQSQEMGLAQFLNGFLAAPERPDDMGRLGDFHVLDVLGAGGMGIVLKAEDPVLRRLVAIKVMRPEVTATSGAKERFLREARSAAAVDHPRVVVIHHVGEWHGAPYIVMPLMAGRSLAARLNHGPSVSLSEAVRFVRETAEGLAAAHARGLVHRDIKPPNIWLEETAEGTHVRVLDFGLARSDEPDSLTRPGQVLGTYCYMSPEQACGQSVDARADLFSLGCVLYEILTGAPPFAGPTLLAVAHALANHSPASPKHLSPTIPARLSDLTMCLLEKSPERRPESAEAVAAKLRQLEQELTAETGGLDVPQLWSRPAACQNQRFFTKAVKSSRTWGLAGVTACIVAGIFVWGVAERIPPLSSQSPTPNPQSVEAGVSGQESGISAAGLPVPQQSAIPTPPSAIRPLQVTAIEVNHFAHTPEGDEPRGQLGVKSFTPVLGDRVQVTARLSRPAYAYLIAFRPDGVAELCFPESEDTPPPLTDLPRYPLADGLEAYGLREGSGLWAFTVVASAKPLPAWREWSGGLPDSAVWAPVTHAPLGVVWWDDGRTRVHQWISAQSLELLDGRQVEVLLEKSPSTPMVLRSKGERLEGPAATIKRLTDALRHIGRVETVSALGFVVAPAVVHEQETQGVSDEANTR